MGAARGTASDRSIRRRAEGVVLTDLSVMLRIHCVQLFYNPGLRQGRF